MGRQRDEEKKFSESLDRWLAGKEVESGEDMSEDYQTAINFAQKLTEFRAEPSSEFKAQLKQRLLLELTRQEVAAREKAKGNWFWEGLKRLVPQSPVWRTSAATLVVIIVVVGVLWRTGMFTQAPALVTMEKAMEEAPVAVEGGAPEEAAVARSLEAEVALRPMLEVVVPSDTIVAPYGEPVISEFVFKNISSETITMANFPPAIQIVGRGVSGPVRSFAEGDESLELLPSETVSHSFVWDQRDDDGKQVAAGWYTLFLGEVVISKETEPKEARIGPGQPVSILVEADE